MKTITTVVFAMIISFVTLAYFACNTGLQKEAQIPEGVDSVYSADGVTVYYEVHGTADTNLVFVHGWSCDRGYWKNQVPEFSRNYRVITVDLAGHGQSGLNRKEWQISKYADDVIAVIDKLGLKEVILIGHSMGGGVIMQVAAKIPDKVIGLIGVDTYQDLTESYSQDEIDGFLTPLRNNFRENTLEFVLGMFPPGADSVLKFEIANDMSSAPPDVALESMNDYFQPTPAEFYASIKAPVYGINSDMYPINADINRQYIPNIKYLVIGGVGHFVHLENPEEFNTHLDEIVTDILQFRKSAE